MARLNISQIDFLNFEEKKLIKDSDLMENGEKVSDLDIIWTWGISQSTAVDYGTHIQASFSHDSIQCTFVTNIQYSPNDQVTSFDFNINHPSFNVSLDLKICI